MKTAVEQLIAEIERRVSIIQSEPQTMTRELMIENLDAALEKFKEMEKEQIINANRDGVDMVVDKKDFISGEQYYNETYGGNK
jgi:hypothetical protein